MFERRFQNLDDRVKMLVDEINRKMDQEFTEVRESVKEIVETLRTQQTKIQKEMLETRKEIKDVRQNLYSVTTEIQNMKAMMLKMMENKNMSEQIAQTLPSPIEMVMNSVRGDILIAGGDSPLGSIKSTVIFSWEEEKW